MFARLVIVAVVVLGSTVLQSAAQPPFRTDGGDEKLPWFVLQPGEFPPAGSAHAISGELISVDHVNRAGVLRVDRNGSQRTDDYDLPLSFSLLPYGSVRFHGAPADLRDVPLGTHLQGQFYAEIKGGKQEFSKAIRLVDDFSSFDERNRLWRVDGVAIDKRTLIVSGVGPAETQVDERPSKFQILRSTQIWKGHEIGALTDIEVGQKVLLNLTVCTLKGPGRCVDIWLDSESRALATAHQLEKHRQFQREHGLACRVDEVDNQQRIVTLTVFDGVDPTLKADFRITEHIAAAVSEETLRTHDQNNDTARGPIVELQEVPSVPGNSGLRLRFKPSELLEGFRPNRIIRIFGPGWPVDDLPLEERFYDR